MLIQRGYYFLDKSLLIKELLDKKGDTNLFTRPRRFGKTLNISMLRYFFEDARDLNGNKIEHSSLFNGLEIMIPNQEVKYIFRTKVLLWFQEKIVEKDLTALYTALLNQDAAALEKELNELLLETISFNDAYENFYHGFIAGVLSKMKGYRVRSN